MSMYELTERVRGKPACRAVELGEVVGVNPLVVRIGNGEYQVGPKGWRFYEPVIEAKKIILTSNIGGVSEYKKMTADTEYKVGDLLAVQQMAGDASFMVLAKVQEVV